MAFIRDVPSSPRLAPCMSAVEVTYENTESESSNNETHPFLVPLMLVHFGNFLRRIATVADENQLRLIIKCYLNVQSTFFYDFFYFKCRIGNLLKNN